MLKLIVKLLLLSPFQSICGAVEVKNYYKWNYINFTWPTTVDYEYNVQTGKYIPENNIPSKIRIYKDRLFMAFGRFYPGTPVTLGYLYFDAKMENPLIRPYPNWNMNVQCACTTLQNVNAFDIDDENGIMWILDGLRHNNFTGCPAKLVLYNMEIDKVVGSYEFPGENDILYLADLVVDNNHAYIADSSAIDPGIVVYSRKTNRSWKIRDGSMFPEVNALKFSIGKSQYNYYHGVSAITISPKASKKNRFIYYSAVSSYKIYKLNVNIVQDEEICKWNNWRQYVHVGGTKVDQSYDYGMNTNGDLYFCLLNQHALAKWNVGHDFHDAKVILKDSALTWCSGFAFDRNGIYILTNDFGKYLIANTPPKVTNDFPFRILKFSYTGKNNNKKS